MRYQIRTSAYHDNEENDFIGSDVDYEDFAREPTAADFPGWDFDREIGGPMILLSRFDQEYDRSAEVWFPVYYSATVEPDPEPEEE